MKVFCDTQAVKEVNTGTVAAPVMVQPAAGCCMVDIQNTGTSNKGGWCIIPSSSKTADTYRFTDA